MTDKERRKVAEWFESRVKNCPMPATRRMYEIAIKALEQESRARWIPCSEKLPEMPFGCLVTVEEDDRNGEPQNVLYSEPVGYDGETWNRADGEPISFEVVAWMPLPEPYKPERSKND